MPRETYSLIEPIEIELRGPDGAVRTEQRSTLIFDWPDKGLRAKHLRATDGASGVVGMTLALLAEFSGEPVRVLEELSEADFIRLYERLEGFRKPGRPTGETSSAT